MILCDIELSYKHWLEYQGVPYNTKFKTIIFSQDSKNYYNSSEELLDDLKNILENKIEPKLLNLFHKKPSAKLLIEGKESIIRSAYDNEILTRST